MFRFIKYFSLFLILCVFLFWGADFFRPQNFDNELKSIENKIQYLFSDLSENYKLSQKNAKNIDTIKHEIRLLRKDMDSVKTMTKEILNNQNRAKKNGFFDYIFKND